MYDYTWIIGFFVIMFFIIFAMAIVVFNDFGPTISDCKQNTKHFLPEYNTTCQWCSSYHNIMECYECDSGYQYNDVKISREVKETVCK